MPTTASRLNRPENQIGSGTSADFSIELGAGSPDLIIDGNTIGELAYSEAPSDINLGYVRSYDRDNGASPSDIGSLELMTSNQPMNVTGYTAVPSNDLPVYGANGYLLAEISGLNPDQQT